MSYRSTGTETTEGLIPHLLIPYGDGFLAPVKLDMRKEVKKDSLYPPLTRDGHLIYALPGGGEFVQ